MTFAQVILPDNSSPLTTIRALVDESCQQRLCFELVGWRKFGDHIVRMPGDHAIKFTQGLIRLMRNSSGVLPLPELREGDL